MTIRRYFGCYVTFLVALNSYIMKISLSKAIGNTLCMQCWNSNFWKQYFNFFDLEAI